MKFNKAKVLHMGRSNPHHKHRLRETGGSRAEEDLGCWVIRIST